MQDMAGLPTQPIPGGFGLPQSSWGDSLKDPPDMGGIGRPNQLPAGRSDMAGFSQGYSDPYWNDVVLLLRFDGYHGSTSIVDSSPRPKICTASGCRIVSTSAAGLMGGSGTNSKSDIGAFFGKSLQMWSTNTAAFGAVNLPYLDCALGSEGIFNGDYTVEMWAYAGTNNLLMSTPRDVNPSIVLSFSTLWNWNNSWNHYVIQRRNGIFYEYLNGVFSNSPGTSFLQIPYNTFTIGNNPAHSGRWNGNIGEVRITRNYARYFRNFNQNLTRFATNNNGYGTGNLVTNIRSQLDAQPVPGPNYKGDFTPVVWMKYLNSAVASGASSITYDLSSGRRPELGDIIVLGVMWRDAGGTTIDTPSGYTVAADFGDAAGAHQSIFWKVSDGTETTFSNTLTGGTSNMAGFVAIIRNADEAGPQGFVQSGDGTSTNVVTGSGLTNVPDLSLCLAIGSEHNYVTTPTCTVTGGYTECVDITQGPAGTNSRALDVAFKEIAVGGGGTIGAPTFTWNSNGTRHQVAEMYFQPRPSPQFA